MATDNDIDVISAAAAMFLGTPNPLPLAPASTLYDSGEHHHVQTGSTNNLETETDIDAISRATAMFLDIPSPAALESAASDFRKQRKVQTGSTNRPKPEVIITS